LERVGRTTLLHWWRSRVARQCRRAACNRNRWRSRHSRRCSLSICATPPHDEACSQCEYTGSR
jgi:hypothetical protein